MIAQELEVSLHMAFVEARQQRHEFITVEHLLLALLDNPSASEVLKACSDAGVRAVAECFADRAYDRDGRLVPRSTPDAVIHDAAVVVRRAVEMATSGTVTAIDGATVRLAAESMCVHGDTPGSAALMSAVRNGLRDAGVELRPFV